MIPNGSFIRVRIDHPDPFTAAYRGGKDGMVTKDFGDDSLGLVFGSDRYNHSQYCQCVGSELWQVDELDFATLELAKDYHE